MLHSWLGTTAIWFFILVFLMKQILQNLYEKDFFLWFTSIQVIYKLYSTWIITKLTNEYFLSFMIFTNMTLKWFFIFKFLMLLMSKKKIHLHFFSNTFAVDAVDAIDVEKMFRKTSRPVLMSVLLTPLTWKNSSHLHFFPNSFAVDAVDVKIKDTSPFFFNTFAVDAVDVEKMFGKTSRLVLKSVLLTPYLHFFPIHLPLTLLMSK